MIGMGTSVIGGMLAASAIAIFLIPVTFYVIEKFSHRKKEEEKKEQFSRFQKTKLFLTISFV